MMGILAVNNIYPATTLAVFHTNLYIFQKCWNFQFFFFFPQVTKKLWKKILNVQENFIWLKWFFKLFIYLFDKHFLKLVTKVCSFFGGCGGRGERFFFLIFFFFELLMCSYHFSKLFPKFSMCPPRMFPIALTSNPYVLPKIFSFSLIYEGVHCDGY
jgi:hypothetical protein